MPTKTRCEHHRNAEVSTDAGRQRTAKLECDENLKGLKYAATYLDVSSQ